MAFKKWIISNADKDKASYLSEKFNIDPFIAYLLVSRGNDDTLSVSSFLGDSFETVSPFRFVDMEEAAFVIGDAVDMGEKICIYGDYDCDGVTSTALLYSFLREENADVFYYIPSREDEGYGLNKNAIDAIHEKGASLIITVDNGISSVDEADYIYSLGMRLVVTDHHQIGDVLPRAEAVVNPHREENDLTFRDYCGVGVAFKLACAMHEGDINELAEKYIDLVAIGTIADVVPLKNENRAFVRAGLHMINNSPRKAVEVFKNTSSGYDRGKLFSSNDIAFQLCPRINAVGRMDSAEKAVEFLIETDAEKCSFRFEQLNTENEHRKEVEKKTLDDVENKIADNPALAENRVIVVAGEGYHDGVIGIVASHIVEKYGKPAFIISIDSNGIARGSARSVEGFNIFDAITFCSDLLVRFGGHPLAAGITLESSNIEEFSRRINEYAYKYYEFMPPPQLRLDCKISPSYLSLDLADSLSTLEPFGAGNTQPVFGVYGVKIENVTPLSEGKHIRLELEKKGSRIRVVKFGTSYDAFPYKKGDTVNLAVKITKNLYNERYYLSVQALDIHLASADYDRYFSEKDEYEVFCLNGKGKKELYPSREICAYVYRFLKSEGGFSYGTDELYLRLQDKLNYSQLNFAIKAFEQAGLISLERGITLLPAENKVRLEETPILRNIRERLNIG